MGKYGSPSSSINKAHKGLVSSTGHIYNAHSLTQVYRPYMTLPLSFKLCIDYIRDTICIPSSMNVLHTLWTNGKPLNQSAGLAAHARIHMRLIT